MRAGVVLGMRVEIEVAAGFLRIVKLGEVPPQQRADVALRGAQVAQLLALEPEGAGDVAEQEVQVAGVEILGLLDVDGPLQQAGKPLRKQCGGLRQEVLKRKQFGGKEQDASVVAQARGTWRQEQS